VAGAEEAVAGMQQAASLIAGYSSLIKYQKVFWVLKMKTNYTQNNKKRSDTTWLS
jgi:hypothetical protein